MQKIWHYWFVIMIIICISMISLGTYFIIKHPHYEVPKNTNTILTDIILTGDYVIVVIYVVNVIIVSIVIKPFVMNAVIHVIGVMASVVKTVM